MGLLNSLLFMLNEMSPYILLGFFIAGLMHAFVPQKTFAHHLAGKEHAFSLLSTISSAVLVILLVVTFIKGHKRKHINVSTMTKEYKIKGMHCSHCQATVVKSISSVKGVKQVDVNLSTGIATVEGEHNAEDVVAAVRDAGFDVVS